MEENPIVYEKIIAQNDEKAFQIRLVVSEFRDKYYLSFRKYFLSFDEDFVPSKEGISIEYEMDSSLRLLEGMLDVIPLGECKHLLDAKIKKESEL